VFFGDSSQLTDDGLRLRVRAAVLSQLTFDPMFGNLATLNASGPVILAWGRADILDIRIENQTARRNANVLYYYPVDLAVEGRTTFTTDLIGSTVVSTEAAFFSKDPFSVNMGAGSATIAYQPIGFDGRLAASELQLALNFNGNAFPSGSPASMAALAEAPITCTDPANTEPAGCEPPRLDGLPEVELLDRTGRGTWVRLPHLGQGSAFTIADPERYIDPATGQVLVRFVNEQQDSGVGFQFQIAISGEIS